MKKLNDILMTYCMYNFDLGTCNTRLGDRSIYCEISSKRAPPWTADNCQRWRIRPRPSFPFTSVIELFQGIWPCECPLLGAQSPGTAQGEAPPIFGQLSQCAVVARGPLISLINLVHSRRPSALKNMCHLQILNEFRAILELKFPIVTSTLVVFVKSRCM